MFLIEDLRGEVEVTAFSRAVKKHQSGSMFQTRWAFSGTIYPVPVFHVNTDETWEAIILEIRSIRHHASYIIRSETHFISYEIIPGKWAGVTYLVLVLYS